jgi:hypothetical protein
MYLVTKKMFVKITMPSPFVTRIVGGTPESFSFILDNVPRLKRDVEELTNGTCHEIATYIQDWIANYVMNFMMTLRLDRKRFMLFTTARGSGKIVGLAGCIIRPRSLYVDFLCSGKPGVGSRLVKHIKNLTVRLGKQGVELVSLNSAAGFWRKMGLRRGPLNKNPAMHKNAHKRFRVVKRLANHAETMTEPTKENIKFILGQAQKFAGTQNKRTFSRHFPNPVRFLEHAHALVTAPRNSFQKRAYFNKNELMHTLPKYSAILKPKQKKKTT